MTPAHSVACITLTALVALTGCEQRGETNSGTRDTATPSSRADAGRTVSAPDNTANNKGDGSAGAKTPLDQSQTGAGVKITADIRRAIMDDKSMSTNAQNCKIITDNAGVVTLRGVVSSQVEKDAIQAKAQAVEGVSRVDNQLEIKPN